jgi:hypothetical protein
MLQFCKSLANAKAAKLYVSSPSSDFLLEFVVLLLLLLVVVEIGNDGRLLINVSDVLAMSHIDSGIE